MWAYLVGFGVYFIALILAIFLSGILAGIVSFTLGWEKHDGDEVQLYAEYFRTFRLRGTLQYLLAFNATYAIISYIDPEANPLYVLVPLLILSLINDYQRLGDSPNLSVNYMRAGEMHGTVFAAIILFIQYFTLGFYHF
ncbi:hypothetical protein BKK52_02740 [Rodentibacter trehalosifermentans]|uniref:Uncharacterized protein n=1 Tax=Rodentibacter trehalosifermentans TaxID=1908263 RepID=A0A1V3J3Q1_9PAST|nr:hypothetical protein [Rodentibacter trehalosifermentans]OOF49748.1 hypothetical protein BKK52_02740 [Rodentibacter trehalosifermentans]